MMKDTINKLLFVVDETLTVNTIRTRRYSRLTGTFSLWLHLIVLLGVTLLATSAQNDFVSLDSVRDNSDCPLSKNDVSQTEGLNGLYRLRTTVMGQLYSTNIFRNCIGVFYRVLRISVGRFSFRRSVGRSVHPLVTFVYFSRFSRCCSCKSVCLASTLLPPSTHMWPLTYTRPCFSFDIQADDCFTSDHLNSTDDEHGFQITEHHLGNEFVCSGHIRGNGETDEIRPIVIKNYLELVKLKRCSVIEGSLRIFHVHADFSHVSFPKLVEITGHLVIAHVQGRWLICVVDLSSKRSLCIPCLYQLTLFQQV